MNLAIAAVILGIVEGLTEFLPISSTGHLILTIKLLGLSQTDFLKSFEIVIQLGAILAVLFLYGRTLLINIKILKRVIVAFIPTAILGLLFYKVVKNIFMNSEQIVLWSLFLGGLILIVFEFMYKEKKDTLEEIEKIPYHKACLIGIFQSFAVIPGVSRAAATIIGGLILGFKRKTIVEFSFLLAIPTMLAASGWDLMRNGCTFSMVQFEFLAIGFVTSFFVAILSIKLFLRFIKNHNFMAFGFYRVILATAFWLTIR